MLSGLIAQSFKIALCRLMAIQFLRCKSRVNSWVEFGDNMKERPKEFHWFEGERLLLRRLVNRRQRLMASLTNDTFITNKNLYSLLPKNIEAKVLLGVLNSQLLSYLYISQVTQAVKDDFPQVTIKDIMALPFPSEERIIEVHDQMVSLVERMLALTPLLSPLKGGSQTRTPQEMESVQRQVEATDKAIDRLVYELYGLTEEEIRIVEGG
jgi:adenine-specific DNA-methyltransferase